MRVQNLFDLRKKVAVVTGGTGHLGKYISEGLAEAGATVYIASRNEVRGREIAKLLQGRSGSKVDSVILDVRSMESANKCFSKIELASGRIDILVNNATFSGGKTMKNITELQWIEGIDGTINSVFRTTKAAIPFMQKNKTGSIINVASMYGMVSPDPRLYKNTRYYSPPSYGPGKSAIIQFTRYAACYFAKQGIRINAISPGPFPNDDVQKDHMFISRLAKKTPLGRIGKPEELKGVIVFLASNASSYITGINIPVDGGWTAW